jgi:hypothetical protein
LRSPCDGIALFILAADFGIHAQRDFRSAGYDIELTREPEITSWNYLYLSKVYLNLAFDEKRIDCMSASFQSARRV